MASLVDLFDRANNASLGANFTEENGDARILSNAYSMVTASYGYIASMFTGLTTSTANQYFRGVLKLAASQDLYPEIFLRYSGAANPLYQIELQVLAGTVSWSRKANIDDEEPVEVGPETELTFADNDTIGITVDDTGNNTVVRIWKNPGSASPSTAALWNGSGPNITYTQNPGSPVNSGTQVGIGGYQQFADNCGFYEIEAGDIPTGSTDTNRTPLVGALALSGVAPSVTQQLTIRPNAGAVAIVGVAPAVAGVVTPATAGLAIAGAAPVILASGTITPAVGALSFLGYAPGVFVPQTVTPSVGALALTGIAPVLTQTGNVVRTPISGALVFSGNVSDQDLGVPSPVAGALSLVGQAPSVAQGSARLPLVGALSINGIQATVRQSFNIQPATGALTLAGVAPSLGSVVSKTPLTATLTLQGFAPTVTVPNQLQPLTQNLGLVGQQPTVQHLQFRTPGTGTLTITGTTPVLGTVGNLQIPTAALGLSGSAPLLSQAANRIPTVAALTIAGIAPTVIGNTSKLITPDTGALVIGPRRGDTGAIRHARRASIKRAIRNPLRTF